MGGKDGLGFVLSGSIKQAGRGVWELVAAGLSENLSLKGEEKGIWEKGRLRGFF